MFLPRARMRWLARLSMGMHVRGVATPMMQQYESLRREAEGAILFFRMGDFYELFGEQALEISSRLRLTLAKRGDEETPFCGVPHHSAAQYWTKLAGMGYTIAIADQLEDAAATKGLVRRGITRWITPGTVELGSDEANFLAALHEDPHTKSLCLAMIDISSGECRVGKVAGFPELKTWLEAFQCKELLCRRALMERVGSELFPYELKLTPVSEAVLREQGLQVNICKNVFGNEPLDPFVVPVLAGILGFLSERFFDTQALLQPRPLVDSDRLVLDEIAVRDLELFQTRRGEEGSLFNVLRKKNCVLGSRRLREELSRPLMDAQTIENRQKIVAQLQNVRQWDRVPDLIRLRARLACGRILPGELLEMADALRISKKIANVIPETFRNDLVSVDEILEIITSTLGPEAHTLGTDFKVFNQSYDADFDRLRTLFVEGDATIDRYAEGLRIQLEISSLKVKFHKSYGYLIEVTKTHSRKIPGNFIRKQTMVNCERFVTSELMDLETSIISARTEAARREHELYLRLLDQLRAFDLQLVRLGDNLAYAEFLYLLADFANRHRGCFPRLGHSIDIKGLRHPSVEVAIGANHFTPNDIFLEPRCPTALITGPNMGGKSTIMRQIAIAAVMHQIGASVLATQASLPIFDQMMTRVGASDDLASGQSTFFVEMAETARILRRATPNSLVIVDEVGRGTSTIDGLAIAKAILWELASRVKSFTIFATHYHELISMAEEIPGVTNWSMEVDLRDGKPLFTHRLKSGGATDSFGLAVAEMAGIPKAVLEKAYFLRNEDRNVDSFDRGRGGQSPSISTFSGSNSLQQYLPGTPQFNRPSQDLSIIEDLRTLKLEGLSPLGALNQLAKWQEELASPSYSPAT